MPATRARRRPVIGITVGRHLPSSPDYARLRLTYTRAVVAAGGVPILLPPVEDDAAVEVMVDLVDGLLFPGGWDVEPARYTDAPRHPKVVTDDALDALELRVAALAVEREIPTLGICRGQQLLNVALGGTLVQDIPDELGVDHPQSGSQRENLVHQVVLEADSRLAEILGTTDVAVNSHHHQSVKTLGRGLRVVGWSPEDGVVEAVESVVQPWLLCVQFHPEDLVPGHDPSRHLFARFVEACAERAGAAPVGAGA